MKIATTPDVEAFMRPSLTALAVKPPVGYMELLPRLIDEDRTHVAYVEGKLVGAAGAYTHTLAVPGGAVAAAAVFGVGVLPSHRRRGILTKLQEVQLTEFHRRGEPISYLWASEPAIYGRFGYGMAALALEVVIETKETKLRDSSACSGSLSLLDRAVAQDRIAAIYAGLWKEHPGMFFRSEEWWRKRLGFKELSYAVSDDAYAIYDIKMNTSFAGFSGEVEVIEALAASVEGYRRIWKYLLSLDLVRTVKASYLPTDHPLILMLDDIRKTNCRVRDGFWVRVVDVEAALKARVLNDGFVTLRVRDQILPHNDAIWRVGPDEVAKVEGASDLIIDISDLGSTYFGSFTFTDLVRSGRAHEQTRGAARRADEIFAWDRKPWCPEQF